MLLRRVYEPAKPVVLVLALLFTLAGITSAQTNFITLVPDGAWTWYNDPRALFHNGVLYFGYVRSDGKSALNVFNPSNGASTLLWTSSWSEEDDHDVSGILPLQDGRLLAIYAHHGSTSYFNCRVSLSTNPVAPANWSGESSFTTGAGVTYSNPYQLSGENGMVYNFMRDLNFNPTVTTSTDFGAHWSTPQILIQAGTNATVRPYVKYCSNYSNRVDVLYTDGHPRDVTNSLYHIYYQNGSLYKTDGTFLKSFSNIPLLHDSGERGSIVYQYSAAPSSDPNDHIPTGRAWCWETAYQTNGYPVCVFTVQVDFVTGSGWTDDRIYYYYARWTGTNWQKRFIAQAGRPLYDPEDDYAGGICIDPQNSNVIYISSNAGNPFDLSTTTNVPLNANQRYELFRGVSTNGGLSFTWTSVTTNSALDNLRPYIPRNYGASSTLLWFRGVYTTFTSFNTSVAGLFPNAVPTPPSAKITDPTGSSVAFTNLNDQLVLSGQAADNGLSGPMGVSWTTASGPTNALFSNPSSSNTTASFPIAGSYQLQFTASNALSSTSDHVNVNVGPTSTDGPDATRVLWLKFDETSGTMASDNSGLGNNGVLSGGCTWLPAGGMRKGALKFDGVSGVATVPDNDQLDNTSAFTLTYWFRANAYPGDSGGLVSKRDSISVNNSYTTYLKAADKHIYIDIDGSNDRFASATVISTNVWYHVALVFNGSVPAAQRAQLWINGVIDVTATETSAAVPNYGASLRLGNTQAGGATNWFNGLIDDVRFYRRALSANEIQVLALTNTAPSVSIAPVTNATNGIASSLQGAVSDDGNGGPLTIAWRQITGAGHAVFGNPTNASTSVVLDQAGSCTLRLSASDTQATVASDVTFNVSPNTNIYTDWIAQFYPGVSDSSLIGIGADPDNDGVKNLTEFALGMSPLTSDSSHYAQGHPGIPVGFFLNAAGTNFLAMRVQRPAGRLGITYFAEASSNLSNWINSVTVGPPSNNGDGSEIITFRDLVPVSQSNVRFMRLKISQP